MGKEFKKKYMHPTRRKLLDMVHTGEYDKSATVGYEGKTEIRNVGDVWEDEHHKYEKKDGFIVKTGKNHKQIQEIRKYLEEKSKCKMYPNKQYTDKDKKLISSLKIEDAVNIIKEDFVVGGMKPKIKTCIDAMKNGVTKSTILDGRIPHSLVLELFTEHGIGTQIYS